MVVCLPKEKNIRTHTTPNFAFEVFLETRGRHLSCQTKHKRFLLFMFYFSRHLLRKRIYMQCICKECARRSGSGDNDARECFIVLCWDFFYKNRVFQAACEKYYHPQNMSSPTPFFSSFGRQATIYHIFHAG